MLDMYHLGIEDENPENPNEKNYIGSFSLDHFQALTDFSEYAKELGLNLHFFEDFRIKNKDISSLLSYIGSKLGNEGLSPIQVDAYSRMESVLKKAVENNKDIYAFCD